MLTRRTALIGVALAALMAAGHAFANEDLDPTLDAIVQADQTLGLERVKATLLPPPAVMAHEQVALGLPKVVEFSMTIEEKEIVVDDDGTTFQAMTFNGTLPGPTMVVHEGDYVELTLREPGEYLDGGRPVNGPVSEAFADAPLFIMKRQVLRAEYDRCVAAGGCKALDDPQDGALPVAGTNYDDAIAYATWLPATSAVRWRLPTDREWALAAGSRGRSGIPRR